MSYYDDASLVVIPSGYKTSKVYAEKPTDGSGDLAFTRTGDTATRVNSAGLIEKVRTNLILRSEEFDNASWTKTEATITANASTSPIGTTTADKIIPSTNNAAHFFLQDVTLTSGIPYTQSIYAKADGYSVLQITGSTGFITAYANFDLSNGTLGSTDGGIATITSVGNGWYRLTYTLTAIATGSGRFILSVVSSTSSARLAAFAGNGTSGVLLWGAMLEVSDFGATPYIPTTTAAVSVGPVANVPRLDYTGSTCPRLLLEPQRTNLVTYSEQFNNAAWTKTLDGQVTITANTAVSPDGTTSADKMIPSAIAGFHCVQQQVSLSAGSASISVFAKAAEYSFLQIFDALTTEYVNFNLTNGTVGSSDTYVGTIDSLGNGWYRCKATKTVPTGTFSARIGVVTSAAAPRGQSFTGNGTNGLFIWGAQVEASYATSYIPTLAASATRGADACSKTGISSLIGQTEGTLFAEFTVGGADGRVMSTLGGSNRFGMTAAPTNVGFFIVTAAGGVVYSSSAAFTHGARTKMALAYKSGESVLYVNGSAVLTTTATFAFNASITDLYLSQQEFSPGNGQSGKSQAQGLVFKTRLTNAQLAELTTL